MSPGYAVVNDVTAREQIFRRDGSAIGADWLSGKCFPTFLPFGPMIVPRQFVADPYDLTIRLSVNGKVYQDESTADMMIGIERQIAYLSDRVELDAGRPDLHRIALRQRLGLRRLPEARRRDGRDDHRARHAAQSLRRRSLELTLGSALAQAVRATGRSRNPRSPRRARFMSVPGGTSWRTTGSAETKKSNRPSSARCRNSGSTWRKVVAAVAVHQLGRDRRRRRGSTRPAARRIAVDLASASSSTISRWMCLVEQVKRAVRRMICSHRRQRLDRVGQPDRAASASMLLGDREQQVAAVAEIIAHQRRIDARLAGDQRDRDPRRRQRPGSGAWRVSRTRFAADAVARAGRPLPALSHASASFRHRDCSPTCPQSIIPANRNCVGDATGKVAEQRERARMANWAFTQGVHDIGNGVYGYVQPDGTWGWSNAGLIVSDGETLLVDTLMSVPLTRDMLDRFKAQGARAAPHRPAGQHPRQSRPLLRQRPGRRRRDHRHQRGEGRNGGFNPRMLAALKDNYPQMGDAGEFLYETMGRKFDFSGVDEVTLPNRTFDGRLTLTVGDKAVELIDLGPAHTKSDTIVWVPGRPRRLHRRPAVQRGPSDHVGGPGRELDRRLPVHHRPRSRGGGARPRPDHRRRRRAPA